MSDTPVNGTVEPGVEPVYEVFERSFEKDELGAAVCVYVDGCKVVDLWGGWADADRTREWRRDTIACIYSATKGMTATCAHRLVDRGLLDVDEPVATYWPDFAQEGKDRITVRMVLSHQSGLPWTTATFPPEKLWDWETRTAALARSAPVWEPGTRCEYRGGTFGYLVGNVVNRIDGRALATYFYEEVAEPLGADVMIALGPEHDHRCAEMVGRDDDVAGTDSRRWRAAGDGAATGHATAAGLARVYAALARGGELDGVRLLRAETMEAAVREQALLHADGTADGFGLGYQLREAMSPGLLGTQTFGHGGLGGSIGLADPTKRLGFGYVMNQMFSGGRTGLLAATYRSLGA
jgi:CubicO group peptidase (beta-lactamase class C family)